MAVRSALYEQLVDATGTGAFGDILLDAADEAGGAAEIFAYWFDEGETPFMIASSGRAGSSKERAAAYAAHFFEMDPALSMARGKSSGLRSARFAATEVKHSGYRHKCFEHPGLTEKICCAWSREGRAYAINFYRRRDSSNMTFDGLTSLAEMALPLLRKHVQLLGDESHLPLPVRVEKRLGRAFPLLSQRERQVCARTLVGMTSEAISLDLSISTTTVLTYRRRAYERYSLSCSQEMMGRIIC